MEERRGIILEDPSPTFTGILFQVDSDTVLSHSKNSILSL
jgi:hypothetical protein